MQSYYLNKLLLWMPLAVIAILKGAFRAFILNPILDDFYSHQISSLLLILLIFLCTEFVYGRPAIKTSIDAWSTGIIWLVLTIVFEFALGYFVLGSSSVSMLAAYNLLEGNLLAIGIVFHNNPTMALL